MPNTNVVRLLAAEAVHSLGLPYDVHVAAHTRGEGEAYTISFTAKSGPYTGMESLPFTYRADWSSDDALEEMKRLFKAHDKGRNQ